MEDSADCTIDNTLFTGDDIRLWAIGDEIGITSNHGEYFIATMDRREIARLVVVLTLWLADE